MKQLLVDDHDTHKVMYINFVLLILHLCMVSQDKEKRSWTTTEGGSRHRVTQFSTKQKTWGNFSGTSLQDAWAGKIYKKTS